MVYLLFFHLSALDKIEQQIAAAAARQAELEVVQLTLQTDISRFQSLVRAKTADQARSRRHKKIVLRKIDFSQSTTATYLRGIMNNPSEEGK
jgi:hypothetical protein